MRGPSQGEGCCTQHAPWVVRLGGPPVDGRGVAGFTGLIFSAENPCGATIVDATADPQTPMQVIARWGGCIGDEDAKPGDLVVIQGSVVALVSENTPEDPITIDQCGANTQATAPEVKLVVRACGIPEPIIIDADSEIVVPAGPATIEVIAPAGWQSGPRGPSGGSGELPWETVVVRVQACPCRCSRRRAGVLTQWLQMDFALTATPVPLARPRRGYDLYANAVNATGGATVSIRQSNAPSLTPIIGEAAGTQFNMRAPFYGPRLTSAGVGYAFLRWVIE